MSIAQERIAQLRKMATDDPENELGHFRLGQELMRAGQHEEAVESFRRTLELSPQFSRVYQLLASCLLQLGRPQRGQRKGFCQDPHPFQQNGVRLGHSMLAPPQSASRARLLAAPER